MEDVLEEGDPVAQFSELLTLFEEPHPAFELALRWLARHRPVSSGRTIVHGDFAPWNLRERDGAISAFDWEYGQPSGLPLLDELHYRLQVGFLLENWSPDQAAEESARKFNASLTPPKRSPIRAAISAP